MSATSFSSKILLRAIGLGSIPASSMLLFTWVGLGYEVPRKVAGALQNLAAGILLASIGTELLPIIVAADGFSQCMASFFGFFTGVFLLIALGVVLPEDDEENEDEKEEEGSDAYKVHPLRRASLMTLAMSGKSFQRQRPTQDYGSVETKEQEPLARQRHYASSIADASFLGASIVGASFASAARSNRATRFTRSVAASNANARGVFPTVLMIAVAVDSLLDGLLIGLVTSDASSNAGPMLAASISVEMGFLGLTMAIALQGLPLLTSIPSSMVGPLTIIFGAGLGGMISSILSSNPVLYVGLISFGVAALLFMVAEELLLEAHEGYDGHVWWVDLQLFVGFFVSLMMDKLM